MPTQKTYFRPIERYTVDDRVDPVTHARRITEVTLFRGPVTAPNDLDCYIIDHLVFENNQANPVAGAARQTLRHPNATLHRVLTFAQREAEYVLPDLGTYEMIHEAITFMQFQDLLHSAVK